MATSSVVCPACGARIEAEAKTCGLCGEVLGVPEEPPVATPVPPPPVTPRPPVRPIGGVICATCDWRNPANANFCNQCGAPIMTDRSTWSVPPPDPAKAPLDLDVEEDRLNVASAATSSGWPLWGIIGIALGIVAVLYGLTVWSNQTFPTDSTAVPEASNSGTTVIPLAPEVQQQADVLLAEIEASPDAESRFQKQEALINVYIQAQRFDKAADVQEDVVAAFDTAASWAKLGNLWFDWMDRQPPGEKAAHAQKAIAAYQKSLDHNPDNLDVRTDMGIAYLYDPQNPMEAVNQTQLVLEKNPNHIQANFNLGIMRWQIGRVAQARAQFEKVKTLTQPGDPVYERAVEAIGVIDSQNGANG